MDTDKKIEFLLEDYRKDHDILVELVSRNHNAWNNHTITLSAAALGLSITLIDNVVILDTAIYMWLLFSSWIGFCLSILITYIRFYFVREALVSQHEWNRELFSRREVLLNLEAELKEIDESLQEDTDRGQKEFDKAYEDFQRENDKLGGIHYRKSKVSDILNIARSAAFCLSFILLTAFAIVNLTAERAENKALVAPELIKSLHAKYDRNEWKHWSDFDRDCMDTRHETLLEQADGPIKLSPGGCSVKTGVWDDPFSGKTLTDASDLDVDHIIPLKWAHDHGGSGWSKGQKELFANDPINLLAVDDGLNQSKGSRGPDEWMPPNKAFRCEYLSMWQKVLDQYKVLKMTVKEEKFFQSELQTCEA